MTLTGEDQDLLNTVRKLQAYYDVTDNPVYVWQALCIFNDELPKDDPVVHWHRRFVDEYLNRCAHAIDEHVVALLGYIDSPPPKKTSPAAPVGEILPELLA